MVHLASFWKSRAFSQTELPDRSILIGQKLVGNAKIEKFKFDTLGDFQTLCEPPTQRLVKEGEQSK